MNNPHSRSPTPPRRSSISPPISEASSSTAFSPPTSFSIPLRKGSLHPFAMDVEKATATAPPLIGTGIRPWRTKRLIGIILGSFLLASLVLYHGHSRGMIPGFPKHDTSLGLPPTDAEGREGSAEQTKIEAWGLDLRSDRLLAGLRPWEVTHPQGEDGKPLSGLGKKADDKYNLGASTLGEYRDTLLEFVDVAFPKLAKEKMKERILGYLDIPASKVQPSSKERVEGEAVGVGELVGETTGDSSAVETSPGRGGGEAWDAFKMVWQTDKDTALVDSYECSTWRGPNADGWKYGMVTDPEADKWLEHDFADSRILEMWRTLPIGILRSDTIRYLLLLIHGGVYTDTDTILLKNLNEWGRDPQLWRNGDGWLTDGQRAERDAGKSVDEVLGRPSVVVGVEADVGTRGDWSLWWPRPIQVVQWTMASAQYHPIALSAVLRVLHSTAIAVDWAHDHAHKIKSLNDLGRYDDAKALAKTTVIMEPKDGAPLGIMNWTGPSVWTDAVLSYLKVKYGMKWTDLRSLQKPLRVGDVVILPVTGFSPGVGQFGSKGRWGASSDFFLLTLPSHDILLSFAAAMAKQELELKADAQAMAEHKFKGSWKEGH